MKKTKTLFSAVYDEENKNTLFFLEDKSDLITSELSKMLSFKSIFLFQTDVIVHHVIGKQVYLVIGQ
jgi:hypothetical protein